MIYQLDNAVHARFATKFAISLQVVSLHVKAFSQQFGKPTKKTDLVVCYLHCASSNSSRRDETTGYVQESMERASHHVDMKQNSVVYLRCDDVSLGSLRLLEETAARKESRCMSRVHVLDKT